MPSKTPDQVLEDYFSDMLSGDEPDSASLGGAIESPVATSSAATPSATAPSVAIKSVEPERAAQLDVDEELEKKLKLERLLNSARAKLKVAVEPVAATKVEAVAEVKVDALADVEVPAEVSTDTAVGESVVVAPASESAVEFLHWCDNGRPQWAQDRFEVLLFSVSGLTLAVPLIALGQIQPLTEDLTPLFGQADWFMGLQPSPAGEIRTVNTALFVMPERYDPAFEKSAQYVVSLSGVPWGLAVDTVNQPIVLGVDDVKWRGERSKRPWLAGTVKGHMCALLDIPQMAQMLLDADHAKRSG